jgi:hypothetical protein
MYSHHNFVEMTRKYRKEHDLMGFEADDLLDDEFDFLREEDIFQYRYPDEKEIEQVGVRGIYLNNYIRWDSRLQHEEMIRLYGYESTQMTRTFDTYNDVDCWNYADLHDYIKLIKHGYCKVFDHASREIRLGHMSREQGIELVKKYMYVKPANSELFFNWLGITESAFQYIMDQFRNPKFWCRDENWQWKYREEIFEKLFTDHENKPDKPSISPYEKFILTPKKASADAENEYTLIGKGVL